MNGVKIVQRLELKVTQPEKTPFMIFLNDSCICSELLPYPSMPVPVLQPLHITFDSCSSGMKERACDSLEERWKCGGTGNAVIRIRILENV